MNEQHISLFKFGDEHRERFRDQLLGFQLPAEQLQFTGLPGETLQDIREDAGKAGVVIVYEEQAVGFFILHTGEGISNFYQDYEGAVLLRAFLIDYASQGRGFAKAAMLLLPDFIRCHYPEARQIVLAVNEENYPAKQLYAIAGFKDNGLRRRGSKGAQRILQYELSPESIVLPMKEHEELYERLTGIFSRSMLLADVFKRAQGWVPFPYYIGAGCLAQTVWNELTGRAPEYGISDIDIVYFDAEDLSYAAEDEVIKKGKEIFEGISVPIDLKNQARVHLWYPQKFGVEIGPYQSLEAAIDTWPTTVTSLGARLEPNGEWKIYAPFGLEDLFQFVLRPNKTLITEQVYLAKIVKWKSKWPELTVIPWSFHNT
ncbi:nucleotidyltransferase family protein [Paenibacillus sp. FSL H8-0048]|uniref:nucleotidyltransferase family protein n=2 Tax=unclassified Paenibacillus TaxID=185978 RepID=UPI0030FC9946